MRKRVNVGIRSVAFGAVCAVAACTSEPASVGEIEAVYVPPAERVEIYSVNRSQTFGGLLYQAMDANEQAALLLAFQEHADPRRLAIDTEVTFRFLAKSDALRGIDVEVSADETVRLDRDPILGWTSRLIETPVFVDTVYASGEISDGGGLWSSVVDNPVLEQIPYNDRNNLIDHLDRVFQWSLDFSRQLRVGDTYRFAFEQEVRPDGSMRAGRLLAAEYVNAGMPYHAIYFDPNGDGRGSYFDMEGQSVRRAFLLKPLEFRRISGRFQAGRLHPILNTIRAHRGVDYAADIGTPIMATADGVVIHRGPKGGLGNTIEIRHPNGWVTRYAHLNGYAPGIYEGSRVRQSDVIGYVGMTGLATGPHLHYEMLANGVQFDPLSVDLPAGDPVPSDDMVRWEAEKGGRVALLETIPRAGPVRTFNADGAPTPDDDLGPDGGA
ncbi:MAG: peptidoglycan DD-metalloendopeptidase family protein [Gemmatimonadota bacterium]